MLEKILYTLLAFIAVLGVSGYAFYETSDQFGSDLSDEQMATYKASANWDGEIFINQIPTPEDMSYDNIMGMLDDFFNNPVSTEPEAPVEVLKVTKEELLANTNETQLLWFGHSSAAFKTSLFSLII